MPREGRKDSKEIANYRAGSPEKRCAQCTMFAPPHSCTAVTGYIEPAGVCDYFKRRKRVSAKSE